MTVADRALLPEFRRRLRATLFSFLESPLALLESKHGTDWLDDAEHHFELLRAAFPRGDFLDWIVEGFITFNREILREEREFARTGHYSQAGRDLAELHADVYENAEVMQGYYLVGLFLSYFCWPHHYELLGFFRTHMREAYATPPRSCMEWGVGHGLLSLNALELWPDAQARLYDLSVHSLDFSRSLLGAAGQAARCTFVQGDVVRAETPTVDGIICGELLEHVPDPAALLRRLAASLNPGGRAFLTGAVNAAQFDHVTLFRSPDEILALLPPAGLVAKAVARFVHPAREGQELAPTVVALVLERAP